MSLESDSGPGSPVISQQIPNGCKQSTPLSDRTNKTTTNDLILEVRKTNNSIANFSNRMDAMESRLKSVEQQQKAVMTPSSSGDSSVELRTRCPQ